VNCLCWNATCLRSSRGRGVQAVSCASVSDQFQPSTECSVTRFITTMTIVVLGSFMLSLSIRPLNAACDQKCRERQIFAFTYVPMFFTWTGIQYRHTDCSLCVSDNCSPVEANPGDVLCKEDVDRVQDYKVGFTFALCPNLICDGVGFITNDTDWRPGVTNRWYCPFDVVTGPPAGP